MKCIISEELSVREVGGEIFVLDRSKSIVHAFNEQGAYIWKRLPSHSLQNIAHELSQQYDVTVEQADADIHEFVIGLANKGLVRIID